MNETFRSKINPRDFFTIQGEGKVDYGYLIVFKGKKNTSGKKYNLEVQYFSESKKIKYTLVYLDENVDASDFISNDIKKQIETYIYNNLWKLHV